MPISYLNPVVEKSMRRLVVYTLLIQDYWLQYFSELGNYRAYKSAERLCQHDLEEKTTLFYRE